jgi:hypothetical protein
VNAGISRFAVWEGKFCDNSLAGVMFLRIGNGGYRGQIALRSRCGRGSRHWTWIDCYQPERETDHGGRLVRDVTPGSARRVPGIEAFGTLIQKSSRRGEGERHTRS